MSNIIKIMGIDPGGKNIGISIVWLDTISWEITDCTTTLIDLSDMKINGVIGDIYHRMSGLTIRLNSLVEFYEPDVVAIEAGFIDKFKPAAYGILSKAMQTIIRILQDNGIKKVIEFSPKKAKSLIGVKKIDDKEDVLPTLVDTGLVNKFLALNQVSEHEVDAIIIALSVYFNYEDKRILLGI